MRNSGEKCGLDAETLEHSGVSDRNVCFSWNVRPNVVSSADALMNRQFFDRGKNISYTALTLRQAHSQLSSR